MKICRFFIFSLTVSIAATSTVRADNGLNFFPNNMARTVFGSDVQMKVPKFEDPDFDQQNPAAATPTDPKDPAAAAISPVADAPKDKSDLREELAKKYGSPNEEPKVRVQDNAPPAFKAMMEALDSGDNELAYDYARQYTKSLQKYQAYYKRVVSMTGEVMKDSGDAKGTPWDAMATMKEDQEITEKKRNERAQAILAQAEKDESAATRGDIRVEDDDAIPVTRNHNRVMIHAALAKENNIPQSPDGKVNVFYMFDAKSPADMRASALEVEKLAKFRSRDTRVQVVGASIAKSSPEELAKFRADTKTDFLINDGSEFAKKLGVKNSPTVIITIPNQKNALIEEGGTTFEYLDELISSVQGVGK